MIERKTYQQYVKKNAPKSPMLRTLVSAFIVGGIICCIGEGFGDMYRAILPGIDEKTVAIYESCTMIFLGSLSPLWVYTTNWGSLPAVDL